MAGLSPNTLNSLTDKFFVKKVQDNFFLNKALWKMLRDRQETFSGGRAIQVPIAYANSTNGGAWGGGAETLEANFQDNITQATFAICQYYSSMAVPQTEVWLNNGPAKVDNLLKKQAELMLESFNTTLGADIFGDGALNAGGKKTLDGLKAVCTTSGADPSIGAYGGITRVGASGSYQAPVGNQFWSAAVFAANANTTVTFWKGSEVIDNLTTISYKKLLQAFGFGRSNGETPDIGVCNQQVYNAIGTLAQLQSRQMTTDQTGKLGFSKGLEFEGIPIVVDDNCPSGELYFLNLNHLMLRMHDIADFYATEFRKPANQEMLLKYVFCTLNLVCDKPNTQVRMTGITG